MGVKARARPASERRETPRCGLTKGLVEANGRSLLQDLDMQRQWQRVAARQGGGGGGGGGWQKPLPPSRFLCFLLPFCVFCGSPAPPPKPARLCRGAAALAPLPKRRRVACPECIEGPLSKAATCCRAPKGRAAGRRLKSPLPMAFCVFCAENEVDKQYFNHSAMP